ncbi:hypothetical protein, partial [Roseateles chitosanitabidus]|uniref:hypothetical protein n=1 Tax=Roseateles chitosanitabidus TaxID=65048 RepID=UPI001C3F7F67
MVGDVAKGKALRKRHEEKPGQLAVAPACIRFFVSKNLLSVWMRLLAAGRTVLGQHGARTGPLERLGGG